MVMENGLASGRGSVRVDLGMHSLSRHWLCADSEQASPGHVYLATQGSLAPMGPIQ